MKRQTGWIEIKPERYRKKNKFVEFLKGIAIVIALFALAVVMGYADELLLMLQAPLFQGF